ncbi:unnamed protein product [Penicillium glandicola]
MSLFTLPNELLLVIAEILDSEKDINAFARTSRDCYILLNPFLYAYNVRQRQGSALHWAATQGQSIRSGHANIVALLLAHGADPHAKVGWESRDAITTAVLRNQAAAASILIDNGVDVNSTAALGDSLLHLAAQKYAISREAVVRLLIEKGANLEHMNERKYTPLQVACQYGSVEVARCLIESGADLHTQDRGGRSLLHLASSNEVNITKLLVEKGLDVNAKDETGETPLHMACWKGRVDTAAFLLDQGADIEARSLGGHTPLLRGVIWETNVCRNLDPPSVTALLLERGANPSRGNDYNVTPLHCATSKVDTGLCEMLLQHGADLEPRTTRGMTPLHRLALCGSLEPARHLLQKGVDAQPRDSEGNTPLHMAAQKNNVEFVRLLLEAGADRLIKNHKGKLPVHLSSEGAEHLEKRKRQVMDLLEAQPHY